MATFQVSHPSAVEHNHSHGYRAAGRRSLLIVLGLVAINIAIEITGGILSGSLGLLAHATHMVTDAVAISLALFAMWIAECPATITRTFGYHRVEVLVVLVNAIALLALASWIFYEAYNRFREFTHHDGHEVHGGIMLVVAVAGMLINVLAAWILYRSSRHNINVEGAFWHIAADLAGSVVVVVSGVLVLVFDWDLVDPILSVLMGTLVMAGSFRLFARVSRILLEDTPAGLDMYQLCNRMEDLDGVTLVHDIHAWTITTGYNALAAHVLVDPGHEGDVKVLMRRLHGMIQAEFGVQHITLQMEQSASDCYELHHVGHLAAREMHRA